MEKINIAQLLKDCPQDMELYSPLCGDCKLYSVDDYNITIEIPNRDSLIILRHDGTYCVNGEIMLFPKGKTTWEGFVPPCEFKKESENDERMWKLIKKYVHYNISDMELNADHITREQLESWLEKQDEQKPTDKVEPKFKVGKWIVNNISKDVFLIKSINNGYCSLEDIKGNIISPCLPPCESCFHLWTIQDAKDGDVLVDKYNNIGIFQKCVGICWYSYIYLGCDGKIRGFNIGGSHGQTDTNLATIEQRDLIFQKLKEAGYVWDADNKELKNII